MTLWLSNDNQSAIKQLQQEFADLKCDHQMEIDTLKQSHMKQQLETETLKIDYVTKEYTTIMILLLLLYRSQIVSIMFLLVIFVEM